MTSRHSNATSGQRRQCRLQRALAVATASVGDNLSSRAAPANPTLLRNAELDYVDFRYGLFAFLDELVFRAQAVPFDWVPEGMPHSVGRVEGVARYRSPHCFAPFEPRSMTAAGALSERAYKHSGRRNKFRGILASAMGKATQGPWLTSFVAARFAPLLRRLRDPNGQRI
jgi:hypothetical protein